MLELELLDSDFLFKILDKDEEDEEADEAVSCSLISLRWNKR